MLPAQDAAGDDPAKFKFFESKVRPILANRCYECHGPDVDEPEAGLRLDSLAAMLIGGRTGPAIEPKRPDKSLLILQINHDPTVAGMPPKKKLPRAEVAALTKWVAMGAPWPDAKVPVRPAAVKQTPDVEFTEQEKSFWAFQPVVSPPLPPVRNSDWPQSPVDHFVLAKLEASGLQPAPRADRRTLIRRTTIDLLGLPPTPAEVDTFLADDSPAAFARLIDRLLASPHYGERWGRHWLDVARYADSNGMDNNMAHTEAWRYRDYVIRAFNKDKPYDQFVREQIAGDLLRRARGSRDDAGKNRWHAGRVPDDWDTPFEGLIATTILMIGPKMLAEDDPVKQQMDIVDDQIDTVGRAFMGLTLGCARCHAHKFDPIPTADYYSLAGIFKSTKVMLTYRVDSKWNTRAMGDAALEQRLSELERQLDYLDETVVLGNFVGKEDEKKRLTERLKKVKEEYAKIPKIMAVEEGRVEDLQVFVRGNHLTRGALAPRRFLRIIAGNDQPPLSDRESGRRELAEWLTRPDHPLTARVMVNRIWQWHFGEGIVRTPDNFGRLGQRPTHPKLLDWLAARFVEDGWSIKQLHRRIMLSSAYQMSTAHNARAAQLDPENRLLWRMNRRRMEAEVIRDSLLAVSGRLDLSMGGPVLEDKTLVILSASVLRDGKLYDSNRRSVYLPVLRSGLFDVFQAFDFPDPAVVSGRRASTTVAPQALFMMNGRLMTDAAGRMAEQLLADHSDHSKRIEAAYQLAYNRSPSNEEIADWRQFIRDYEQALSRTDAKARQRQIWQAVCRVLLSSNEFVYVE
ncbi:MAG: PSD1 domain-containing protein [Planctomycetes bacterium]|nr:PSD1 domain-containing protein [Planctomycetota bacterium]